LPRGDVMMEWDFSSTAEMVIGILLTAVIVIALA
jgi:hypothetical protein